MKMKRATFYKVIRPEEPHEVLIMVIEQTKTECYLFLQNGDLELIDGINWSFIKQLVRPKGNIIDLNKVVLEDWEDISDLI